ncbi:MAG: thioredoxin domain-containing protein [Candidatus Aenigmarchaeota archaeon]|nr:thioredoxin domain-containing protein [Candidatus Aenigmarchaeota archaeon]
MPRVLVKNFLEENSGTSDLQTSLVKELENRFRGRVEFEYLYAKENEGQVSKYKIRELPTIIIECDGKERERFIGLTQQLFLKKAIEKVLSECR